MFGIWCLNILVLLIAIGAVNGYRINKRALSAPGQPRNVDEEIGNVKANLAELIQNGHKSLVFSTTDELRKHMAQDAEMTSAQKLELHDVIKEYEEKAEAPRLLAKYTTLLKQKDNVVASVNILLQTGDATAERIKEVEGELDHVINELTNLENEIRVSAYKENLKNRVEELSGLSLKLRTLSGDPQRAAMELLNKGKVEEANHTINNAVYRLQMSIGTSGASSSQKEKLQEMKEVQKNINSKYEEVEDADWKNRYEEALTLKEEARGLIEKDDRSHEDVRQANDIAMQAFQTMLQYSSRLENKIEDAGKLLTKQNVGQSNKVQSHVEDASNELKEVNSAVNELVKLQQRIDKEYQVVYAHDTKKQYLEDKELVHEAQKLLVGNNYEEAGEKLEKALKSLVQYKRHLKEEEIKLQRLIQEKRHLKEEEVKVAREIEVATTLMKKIMHHDSEK